ncbi:MAG: N-acetylmuramoyl-L-alanine amidase [Defluviitaleaceae bacterium]|nr:N-acetylmuramoyl-L-alanine amidase [Defluviitaleaceae bacterium]
MAVNEMSGVWPPYPGVVLRRGMNGPSIRQVQERLNQLGQSPPLAADGVFGPLTEAAVVAFQRANGLVPDGVVGPNTWNALFAQQVTPPSVWPPYPGVVLRRGMNGPSIRQVQERLNQLGQRPPLTTDGVFGPLTEAAVIAFQRANGLVPDGIVGPNTWNALFAQNVQPPTPPPAASTVVIDPGHGGHDSGAVAFGRRESDDVLRLSLAVRNILQAEGLRVIMTRATDVFVSLNERSDISNRNNADLFVSIHRNASSSTAANGVENFVFTTAPGNTVRSAFAVLDEVVDVGVQNNRGVLRSNFAVLRNTQAPSMLLEMGFITNVRDNQLFDQNFNAYAAAIARGIMRALSGSLPATHLYTVQSGDSLWSIAQRFGTTPTALAHLNKLTSNDITIGQVLRIP